MHMLPVGCSTSPSWLVRSPSQQIERLINIFLYLQREWRQ